MNYLNLVFGGLFVLMIILGLWLNCRADKRKSWFDESNDGTEIENVLTDMFGEGGSEEIKEYYGKK